MPDDAKSSSLASGRSPLSLFSRLAVLVVVPLLLLLAAALNNAEKEYAHAQRVALATAASIAWRAAGRLDEHYDDLDMFLGSTAELARYALVDGNDVDPQLQRMMAAMPEHVDALYVATTEGRLIAATNIDLGARASMTVSDRSYFKQVLATRRMVISEPISSRAHGQWTAVAARPVLTNQGRPIGLVIAAINVDRFRNAVAPMDLPLGALMTVFTDQGIGISSTNEPLAAIGRDFTPSPAVRRALQERGFAERTASSDGRERLTAYASGEKHSWIVEVGLDIEETLAPARERLKLRLIYLLAALVVGLTAAYWLARWITRPVHSLASAAERIAGGDYAARAVPTGFREVQQLDRVFNDMAAAVESKQHELRASEERFHALTVLSSDWFWEQDADLRFTSVGSDDPNWALPMIGKTRWELNGEPVAGSWADHQALLERREVFRNVVFRYTGATGATAYLSVNGEPVFGADGVFRGYRGTASDVTERYRLQMALAAGEAKFRTLTELSSDWYWEQDEHYRFTFYSTQFLNSDRQALTILGKTRWELDSEPVDESWDEHRACLTRRETYRGKLFRYKTRDGGIRYVLSNGAPVFDHAGTFRGYRGTSTDVTEKMRLENELAERMELMRVTLDTAPVAIGVVRTRDNVALLANRAAHELLRVDPGKREWSVIDYWGRREDAREVKRRIERDGFVRDMEVPVRVPDREGVWALISAQPARYRGEEVTVATLNDITARKVLQAQSKALELQRESLLANLRGTNERLRLLSRQVLDAQEAERRQIAHELHDEIGQNLTALKLFAGHLRGRLAAQTQPEVDEWIELLNRAIEQVRDLSRLLRPVQLDHMGLAAALRALLDTQARAAGWTVDFVADADMPRLDMRQETVVYRVVQEALVNVARHADAARVSLELKLADGQLTLKLADDGRGFDVEAARLRVAQGRSMGLLGMEERVRLAGGTFRIESAAAQGTRIMVVMPTALEAVQA